MKLTTQDGRTIELDRDLHLLAHAKHRYTLRGYEGSDVTAATFTKAIGTFRDGTTYVHGGELVERYGTVATYSTLTGANKAAAALNAAWNSGVSEFTMPADTGEKDAWEKFDEFCRENHLTACAINEVGYSRADEIRNRRIWETTDYFERRGIIICDEYGSYEKSLAKWRALQPRKSA